MKNLKNLKTFKNINLFPLLVGLLCFSFSCSPIAIDQKLEPPTTVDFTLPTPKIVAFELPTVTITAERIPMINP